MVMTAPERLESKRAAARRYRVRNGDVIRAKARAYKALNKAAVYAQGRRHREAVRREAIEKYGGACVRCGIEDWRLLCFDHVNDDGNAMRGTLHPVSATDFVKWLRKQGWPPIVQLLCYNCNALKAHHREYYDG